MLVFSIGEGGFEDVRREEAEERFCEQMADEGA